LNIRELLSIRQFRNLWLGQAISQLGDAFYYVVFMYMVKKVTGSDEMVGFVAAMETLPFLLFGPYAGVLADRMDRRRLMLLSDVVSGGALLVFAVFLGFVGNPPAWLLLLMAFMLSTVRTFFMPAKSAAIPNLVPESKLLSANALSMATQNLMPLIGLGLSASVLGLLYEVSPRWFYTSTIAINSISFLASAVFIAKLPELIADRAEAEEQVHPLRDFKEGMLYVGRRHDLKVLISLLAVFRLMVAPFFVVYIAANDKWFDGRPQNISWWEFSFFLGMVVSSFFAGRFDARRPGLWFSIGLAIVGVTVGAMAFSPFFWLFVLWNVLAGLALPPADIPINTYLQLSVPDEYRGRVNSVVNMIGSGAMPIGAALGGAFVGKFGIAAGFLTMGIGMIVACSIGLLDPVFRNIEMPRTSDSGPESDIMPKCQTDESELTKAEKATTSAPS
jgi:MFS family permease